MHTDHQLRRLHSIRGGETVGTAVVVFRTDGNPSSLVTLTVPTPALVTYRRAQSTMLAKHGRHFYDPFQENVRPRYRAAAWADAVGAAIRRGKATSDAGTEASKA